MAVPGLVSVMLVLGMPTVAVVVVGGVVADVAPVADRRCPLLCRRCRHQFRLGWGWALGPWASQVALRNWRAEYLVPR